LLVAQQKNALQMFTATPLMYRPVEFTHNLLVPPGASITVLASVVVPAADPSMMLEPPVVTAQPALQPTNMLLAAVVLLAPAQQPAKKLKLPVVLLRPACRPIKVLQLPVVLALPAR
jgi:hypothetical protein